MKKYLDILHKHQHLSYQQAYDLMIDLGNEKFNAAEIASFITVYLMRSITINELQGFSDALVKLSLPINVEKDFVIDIVGTGGDGKHTWNISTLSCFIVAGAGVAVTKHGNYGATSVSGSSNVLENLGYKFSNDNKKLNKELKECNFSFLHAPLFHPALKVVAPIRKSLNYRTVFNMLGPLVNPAKPQYQMIGVFNRELARLYSYLMQQKGILYTIVHSMDGYDEISLTDEALLINKDGSFVKSALELGKRVANESDLYGGATQDEAKKIFLNILNGQGSWQQNAVVLANAATALHGCGKFNDYNDAFTAAVESLEQGKAKKCFEKLMAMQ